MNKIEVKIGDKIITDIPADNNEWEIKIYISCEHGVPKINCKTVRALLPHERGKYNGLVIT